MANFGTTHNEYLVDFYHCAKLAGIASVVLIIQEFEYFYVWLENAFSRPFAGVFRIKMEHKSNSSNSKNQNNCSVIITSGSAMAEGPRDELSVEILQLQNIPFEN